MRIPRKLHGLNDALEVLDHHLREAKGNVPDAWKRLSALELEFVREETAHCIADRVYFMENFYCIQPENGVLTTFVSLWDHQWQVEEAIRKEREATGQSRVIVLKPRQAGITEYSTAVMCHQTWFVPHSYTISVAQAPDVAGHIQRKINLAVDNLPWWMRPERLYHNKGEYLEFQRKDEMERSNNPGLGSVFVTTHAARESGVAIGRTIRNFHGSEISRWASGEIFTGDLEPSMNAPDLMGIMESTGLGSSGFFYDICSESMEDPDAEWKLVFLAAYKAKKFSLPITPKQQPFVLTELEQSIHDRVLREEHFDIKPEFFNWRRRRVKASIKRTGHPFSHYESYPITPQEAFQSSGNLVLPRHKLDEQSASCVRKPDLVGEVIFQGKGMAPKLALAAIDPSAAIERREWEQRLWVWEEPEPNSVYYIGADTALGNQGGNKSAAPVFRAGSGNSPDVQVAEWCGWIPPTDWAKVLYALGMWYNRAEIAVEYQAEGMTTANYLFNELEYPNLYRPRNRDRVGKQLLAYMHWQTTGKTKPLIAAKAVESLLDGTVVIRSSELMSQLYKLTAYKFDRMGNALSFEAEIGDDDLALSWMITLFCLRETMTELRMPTGEQSAAAMAQSNVPQRSARTYEPGRGPIVYGIYDPFFRQMDQTRNLQQAEAAVKDRPGWSIRPVIVSKANTAYSVIHHGSGAEHDLLRQGADSWEITPAAVAAYQQQQRERTGAVDPLLAPTPSGMRGAMASVGGPSGELDGAESFDQYAGGSGEAAGWGMSD